MTTRSSEVQEVLAKPYSWVFIPQPTGGYTAKVLEFPGCFAEGETPEEAWENLEAAAASWIQACLDTGKEIPNPRTSY